MALITTQQVIDYTEFNAVKNRNLTKIQMDILRAETDIFEFCGHEFPNEKYPEIPEQIKLAAMILAEYYALKAMDESKAKGYKSESFDDYSYTMYSEGEQLEGLGVDALLKKYIEKGTVGNKEIRFRMRSL